MRTQQQVPPSKAYEGRAAAAAVVAVHVSAAGWVMSRGAAPVGEVAALLQDNPAVVITTAAAVGLIGAGVFIVDDPASWREPTKGWRSLLPARPWYVAIGILVALLMPAVWGAGRPGPGITAPGLVALLSLLPWGVGLAAIGWLRGRAGLVAGLTVALSAAVFVMFFVVVHAVALATTSPTGD
ncbi:hypothetical protein [Actinoplanes sp. NPDC051859]|uniref:hypothetical protein n=1 Tax=Actinoplanes sp. NPDC051859 TaxID=3363909 RepID=UPI003793A713